ncbi:MAG: amino acid permease [Chlamydiales bacterium]|nr:amino acid permease [Chlamydiales bacterium]
MKKTHLSVFLLAMMNVAVIMSLRGLPLMAEEGLTLLFYLGFSALVFLIPTSLVSAELATGWPEGGGVYRWVKEAFGDHAGFTAIWLQWIQNVIWYPTILAFAAGALSYLFLDPSLAANKVFNVVVILVVYWGATLINFRGVVASGLLSSLGVICGTIFPGLLIIGLGVAWALTGKPLAFLSTHETFFPDFSHFKNISFLAGVVLLFAGMEVSAVHANEVKDPKKDYPKAIFLAALIILVVFTFGSLAIASVLPPDKISLTAGLMQGFKELLELFSLGWLLPVMGLLIAFGAIGGVAAWIVGPSKGLFATAQAGDIPPILESKNKNNVPTHILIIQGIIVTALTLVFLLMPTVSTAFFLLTALTAMLYLIMYIMLYAAAIRLRYTQPDVKRTYKIPGGNFGMWFVSGLGIIGALFAIVVGFFPPAQLTIGNPLFYIFFLIGGIVIFLGAPFLIIHYRKPSWKLNNADKKE